VWTLESDPKDAFAMRAAAEALGTHPHVSAVQPLLECLGRVPNEDVLLQQMLRISIKNSFASARDLTSLELAPLTINEANRLAPIAVAVKTHAAAKFLIGHIQSADVPKDQLLVYLQHAARFAPPDGVASIMKITQSKFASDIELQANTLQSIHLGLTQRAQGTDAKFNSWGEELANRLLAIDKGEQIPWTAVPIDGLLPSENPWVLQQRVSQDGDKESMFFCSIVKGEQRTGIYKSAAFELPAKLSFWCAGHDGFPTVKLQGKNLVRLRDAKTHEALASSPPPRNDTAQRIEWDLSKHAGKRGYIELVDGDTAGAYAWMAIGRFSVEGLNPSKRTEHLIAAADIVGKLKLQSLRPKLLELFGSNIDSAARVAIGQALVSLNPDTRAAALVAAMGDPSFPAELVTRVVYAINVDHDEEYLDNLKEVMKRAPTRLQTALAETLAGDAAGAETLVALVKAGAASPQLLTTANVTAKLDALNSDQLSEQVADITANLPGQSEIIDKLVLERRAAYPRATPSLEKGQALFEKHCAACHQIAGKGSVIGPQLDGIGLRGLERLVEDVLDPNRNVDVAFRTTTIRTTDGEVITGLVRREEGATLVLADNKGREIAVPKGDIDQQVKGSLSLMPANVHEIVNEAEFFDLLAYLLSQKQAKEPAK
jgi:putative heme-binding domain-containing protein